MNKGRLYIKVSKDNLELIEAVADTQTELARICGVDISCINHALHRVKKGGRSIYQIVEIEEEAKGRNEKHGQKRTNNTN